MGYLVVFVISLAVAAGVFFVTVRGWPALRVPGSRERAFGATFGREPGGGAHEPPADPEPGTSYVPVAQDRHDWQARMTGVLGLVVSVAVAGIALAVSLYAFGALVARLFEGVGGGTSGA